MFILFLISSVVVYWMYVSFLGPAIYWQRKGLFHVNPWTGFLKMVFGSKSFFDMLVDNYNQFPNMRFYGSYQFLRPAIFVTDLDLIKQITVKDFEYFTDRLNFVSEKADPMSLNLFHVKGEKWREMRTTLSPAFTSAKMKAMYTLIQDTAEQFVGHFFQDDNEIVELEMKHIYSRYSADVIANCAFGMKCNTINDENSEFYYMGQIVSTPKGRNVLRGILVAFIPKLFEHFRISVFPRSVWCYFQKIITDTIDYREKKHIVRPDMIHLLMEARKGRLKHQDEKTPTIDTGFAVIEESAIGKAITKTEVTDDVITAQVLVFFLAGFEITSTMLSFLSYELALNPDIQSRLQKEVDGAAGGEKRAVSYDEILKMKYLDQVVSEILRKYPGGFMVIRQCVKDYKIKAKWNNETDFVVDKGCLVTIPVAGIHRDPKYFPNPEKFDPERFNDENKRKIVPGSYIPFGIGPRSCIATRFALLELKVLIVNLLFKFDIVPIQRTAIPMKFAKSLHLSITGGFWLGFKKRNK